MRRNPPARWALPETVDPATTRCYQIDVPDDPAHIAAFRGALLSLASAYNWADDPSHKAKEVAAVWRDIIDSHLEFGCEGGTMQLRACTDGCGLEYSNDGINWTCVDISACIENIWDEKLAQAFDDGVLGQKGTQLGPSQRPAQDECVTYHVYLRGREQWHCPFPVSAGDTVRVEHYKGGWCDGGVSGMWACPDGVYYWLGLCGADWPAVGGDPLSTANHMEVIAKAGTQYGRPIPSAWSVPVGQNGVDLFLQANDSNIADNQGEIEFDVTICAGSAAFFCYHFNFLLSQDISITRDNNPLYGTYEAGVGWKSVVQANNTALIIVRIPKAGVTYSSIRVVGHTVGGAYAGVFAVYVGATQIINIQSHSGDVDNQYKVAVTGDYIEVYWSRGAGLAGSAVLTDIIVEGNGANPFGVNNCVE